MMKRICCVALALCLVATFALAEGTNRALYTEPLDYAEVEDYSAIKRAQSFVTAGGTLYVLTQSTLEKWTPDMAEPEVLFDKVQSPVYGNLQDEVPEGAMRLTCLFVVDGAVYALDPTDGQVYLAVDASGQLALTPTVKLEGIGIRNTDGYNYIPDCFGLCATSGKLYMIVRDYNTGDYNKPDFVCYDLATGQATKSTAKFIKAACTYKDGQLLVLQRDDENSWDEEKQEAIPPTLAVLDVATDTVTKLLTFEQGEAYGLTYDAATDTLYYTSGARVYSLPGMAQPAKLSAYLASSSWSDNAGALLDSSTFVVSEGTALSVRSLNAPGLNDGALTVYGEYGSSQHMAFTQAYPEIPVSVGDAYYSDMESFTNAMVSGQGAVDVLCLNSSYSPLDRLIDKGYALDLSGYPELTALVDEMYPQFASYVKRDGKLFAVPYQVDTDTFYFNGDAWKTIGLSEADYPTTYIQLLDFVANWEYDYADDYPDINLFDDTSVKSMLMDRILNSYIAYYVQQGQTLTFDTDLMRKLLKALEAIDFTSLEPDVTSESDMEDFWNKQSLITARMGFSGLGGFAKSTFRILALDEGIEPCLGCNMGVLIINPRTPRIDQAVKYVTTYVQNFGSTEANLTLFPNHNDPVPNAAYEKQVADWQTELDKYKAQLETAAPEDVASIQDTIDNYQYVLDHQEEYKYNVSAEDIASYRANFAPYLIVTGKTVLNTWDDQGNNDLQTQIDQYLDGAIDMEQFIKAIDQRVRMMQLENQ